MRFNVSKMSFTRQKRDNRKNKKSCVEETYEECDATDQMDSQTMSATGVSFPS